MRDFITTYATDVKVAASAAIGTTASGVASSMNLLTVTLGDIATVIGSVLSVVLIVIHIRQHIIKMKIMKLKLKEKELKSNLKD